MLPSLAVRLVRRPFGVRTLIDRPLIQKRDMDLSQIPYKVKRSPSGNLPVYIKLKQGGLKTVTVVRHILGDFDFLAKELEAVCQAKVKPLRKVRSMHIEI
eukprot:GEMP01133990.1.p1 GENE.GEMP01133990.1~~GEMP01133990.1.p1  ORF type:complete len:100 (+),score=8.97 GEMP01133990.1:62-361(+)